MTNLYLSKHVTLLPVGTNYITDYHVEECFTIPDSF